MIQRKQTLYLLFAGLITTVLLFIPFGKILIEDSECFEYNAFVVKTISEQTVILSTIGNAMLLIATSALSFITIFFYQNRKIQMKLISINMFLILVVICTIMYIYPNLIFKKNINFSNTELQFNYTILIGFVSAVGLYLAKKAITKDEMLIRSTDRLR